jgi:hypothetical protein
MRASYAALDARGDPARHSIEARRVFYMDSALLLRRMHTAADEAFSTGKRTTGADARATGYGRSRNT